MRRNDETTVDICADDDSYEIYIIHFVPIPRYIKSNLRDWYTLPLYKQVSEIDIFRINVVV